MAKCPKCGASVEDGSKFCDECGAAIPVGKGCPKCHVQLKPNAKFCSECGYSFPSQGGSAAGIAMGDKNVVAGDVIGQKEDYHVSGNATFITNEDETKKMVHCHVCGKHLTIAGAFTCPVCNEITCPDCYDKTNGTCVQCASSGVSKKESEYRALLAKVYEDGKVELSERKALIELQKSLGLSDERAKELEAPFRTTSFDEVSLGQFEEMYCTQAAEELWGKGDADSALKIVESVYKSHPHAAKALSVYFPALAMVDEAQALKVLASFGVDCVAVDSAQIDMELRHENYAVAESRLKTALERWPESVPLRCRRALCLYMAYVKFDKKDALSTAMEIVNGLPPADDKCTRTWQFYLKSLFAPSVKGGFPKKERESYLKAGIYRALACGDVFGIRPVLIDEVVKRVAGAISQEKDVVMSNDELRAIKSAAENGDVDAVFVHGWICVRQKADLALGIELIRNAAMAGLAEAQYVFAQNIDSGLVKGESAIDWYRKAAGQGHALAIAKIDEFDKKCKAEQEASAAKIAAEARARAEKLAAAERERKQREEEVALAATASIRNLLKDGLVKIPSTEKYVAKTQVTQALWRCVMGDNPSHFKGEDRPVESVSLADCRRFIEKLNAREEVIAEKVSFYVPTAEDWKSISGEGWKLDVFYPFRASKEIPHVDNRGWVKTGDNIVTLKSSSKDERTIIAPCCAQWGDHRCVAAPTPSVCDSPHGQKGEFLGQFWFDVKEAIARQEVDIAWTWENSSLETHPVAQKGKTPHGLYDVFGNVAEWCSDGFCMGGGFLTAREDCNKADRYGENSKSPAIGLRLMAYKK